MSIHYVMTSLFGLIHGLGFSNFFKALLGKEESIVQPLLAFNIGVELGQIIIVVVTMMTAYILSRLGLKQRQWTILVSAVSIVISIYLMLGR